MMKTPKELLLTKHAAMRFQLDAMRRGVVADLEPVTSWSLREFLLSLRLHLAGLAAVWLAVLVFNIDNRSTDKIAKATSVERQQWVAAILTNRQEYFELVALPLAPPAALPPRRSEGFLTTTIV